MRDGVPSTTARAVAAYRLACERLPAPGWDSAPDEALARRVAAGLVVDPTGPMGRYLAARTRFFDRVLVGALDLGISQVVLAGAGFDGRAWRYRRPGVRWFELDHPATQGEKRRHVAELGLDTGHVAFVAADFAVDPIAAALNEASHRADRPSLFLCEGVAVYLEPLVLGRLLGQLREQAAAGSRLAISLAVTSNAAETARARAGFERAVEAAGEPARNDLTADAAEPLLREAGWRPLSGGELESTVRARRAGFVVAEPITGR